MGSTTACKPASSTTNIERFHLLPHSRLDLQHRDLSLSNLPDCSHIWA
jgi:hypothetical protein